MSKGDNLSDLSPNMVVTHDSNKHQTTANWSITMMIINLNLINFLTELTWVYNERHDSIFHTHYHIRDPSCLPLLACCKTLITRKYLGLIFSPRVLRCSSYEFQHKLGIQLLVCNNEGQLSLKLVTMMLELARFDYRKLLMCFVIGILRIFR